MAETIRIDIPIYVIDKTENLYKINEKLSGFEKSIGKFEQRLTKVSSKEYDIALKALDKATPVLKAISSGVSGITKEDYAVVLEAIDKASPLIRMVRDNAMGMSERNYHTTLQAIDQSTPVIGDIEQRASDVAAKPYELDIDARDRASPVIDNLYSNVKYLSGRAFSFTMRVADLATAPLRSLWGLITSIQGAVFGTAGAFGGIYMPMELAGNYEQTKIAFQTMLGSEEQALRFLKEAETFANKTPFEFPELLDSSRLLLAFGFEAEKVLDIMTVIGDTSSGLGAGAEGIERMSRAFGQMQAKGRIQAEEMLQLQEVGVPAAQILQEELGLTAQQVADIGKQSLDVSTVIDALLTGMEKRFGGMMDAQSKTAKGMLSTIKDTFQNTLLRMWGEGLWDGTKPQLEKLTKWIDTNKATIDRWAEAWRNAGATISKGLASKIEVLRTNISDMLHSPEWKSEQSIGGKVRIAWDKIIWQPFLAWWQEKAPGLSEQIGKGLGSALHGGIMILLGLNDKGVKDGAVGVGQAFAGGFLEGFKPAEVGKAILQGLMDIVSNSYLNIFSGNDDKSLINTALTAYLGIKGFGLIKGLAGNEIVGNVVGMFGGRGRTGVPGTVDGGIAGGTQRGFASPFSGAGISMFGGITSLLALLNGANPGTRDISGVYDGDSTERRFSSSEIVSFIAGLANVFPNGNGLPENSSVQEATQIISGAGTGILGNNGTAVGRSGADMIPDDLLNVLSGLVPTEEGNRLEDERFSFAGSLVSAVTGVDSEIIENAVGTIPSQIGIDIPSLNGIATSITGLDDEVINSVTELVSAATGFDVESIPSVSEIIAAARGRASSGEDNSNEEETRRDGRSNEGNENNRHGGNENGNERGRREGDGGEGGNPGGLLSRLGVFGASALSTVTTGGLITTALGAVSAMGDYFDAMNAEDEKESRDNIIQGTTKLGMIGTGAGLGLVLGSVVPGIGNLAGAAIGAGIGSVAALMQGGSLGQRISDMIDGTAPMKKFQEEVKAAGEALDKAYEKAQNFVSIDKEVNDLIYDYKVLRDRSEELSSSQNPQDIQEAADAHERMKDIIRQIATIYPDLISQYETENGLLENKIDLIDQVSARNKNLAVLEMQQKAMDVQENLPQMMEDFKQKREAKEAKEASLSKVESAYHDQEWMDSLGKKSAGYIEAYDAHRKYISEHGKINKELQDEAIKRLKDLESHYGQKGVQDALVNNAGELSFDKAYQIAQGDQYAPINESYQVLNQDTITAIKNYDAAYAEIKNAIDTLTESVIISYEAKTGRSLEEDAGKYYELGEVEQKAMQGTLEQINAINQSFANIPEFVPVEFSIRVKDESGALNQISSMELFGADKGPGLTADFGSVSGAMNGYQSVSSIIKEYEKKSGMSFKEAAVNLQELDEAGQKAFMETIDKIKEVIEYLGYIPDTVPIDIVVSLKDESGIIKKKNLSDILTNTLSGLLPQKHATGGILTRPHLGLVAEEGPEAIIPLSPSKRHRGLELWQQTGAMLGMNPMAQRKMRDTKNNNVVSILTHLKDRESVFNRVNGYQTGSYSQGIDLWPGGEQPNIQAHADGGIFGEANESFTPGEEEGNEPTVAAKLDNRQAINITIHVSANPAFTIEAGENEGKIVLALKAHVREMVDDIGDELAERLGGIFANMPLKGA